MKFDPINWPAHYNFSDLQPIDVIEAWGLGFHLGNCLKYVARAGHKNDLLEDLKKARWYLDRYVTLLEAEKEPARPSCKCGGAFKPMAFRTDDYGNIIEDWECVSCGTWFTQSTSENSLEKEYQSCLSLSDTEIAENSYKYESPAVE